MHTLETLQTLGEPEHSPLCLLPVPLYRCMSRPPNGRCLTHATLHASRQEPPCTLTQVLRGCYRSRAPRLKTSVPRSATTLGHGLCLGPPVSNKQCPQRGPDIEPRMPFSSIQTTGTSRAQRVHSALNQVRKMQSHSQSHGMGRGVLYSRICGLVRRSSPLGCHRHANGIGMPNEQR